MYHAVVFMSDQIDLLSALHGLDKFGGSSVISYCLFVDVLFSIEFLHRHTHTGILLLWDSEGSSREAIQ